MTASSRTDPVSTPVDTGSWRRVVLVVATAVVVAGLVRVLLLQSYVLPPVQTVPGLEPGDRVLVLTTDHAGSPGDVDLVDDGAPGLRFRAADGTTDSAVGTVLWRYWPLSRAGRVVLDGAASR